MTKKKIIILAHFFEPCNVIAAHRPKSWAMALHQAGYDVTVVTRQWTGQEKNWDEYLAESNQAVQTRLAPEGYKVIHLPFRQHPLYRLSQKSWIKGSKLLRFLIELAAHCFGQIDFDRDMYRNYFPFLDAYLKTEPVDAVINSAGPYIGIKVVSKLKKKHQFHWLADFRDVWNNDLLKVNKNDRLKRNTLRFFFHRFYLRKWMKRNDQILSCSEGFSDVFEDIAPGKEVIMVKNGYESTLYNDYPPQKLDKFTILCLGTLYQEQNKQFFFQAIQSFLQERGTEKIEIKFIGAKINEAVAREIEANINPEVLTLTGFVDRKIALQETRNAHLLFYPVWSGYKGIYSGKMFEYLGSGRNILVVPKDHSVLDNLLEETGAGKSFDKQEACLAHLCKLYDAWEQSGTVPYEGNSDKIKAYSRESQSQIIVQTLEKLWNK
ncbi:MAG: hypothetical protein EP338_08595 [Bacteroidetes bacterium]|nr:MAG: hypothetical protein EP338_08595 [Bacteroidota bacterium]